jgi:hypothetical protein
MLLRRFDADSSDAESFVGTEPFEGSVRKSSDLLGVPVVYVSSTGERSA